MIAAEGEQKASRALREAAEIVSESPAAIQLRYLQVYHFSCSFTLKGGLNFLLGWYKRKFNSDAKMHNSRICSQIYIIVKVKQLKSFF